VVVSAFDDGRLTSRTQKASASETNRDFYPTGELKKTCCSQIYTVDYTYDLQSRDEGKRYLEHRLTELYAL